MKFYNREKEISRLHETDQASQNNAQLTVVTGRRRIGKTQLILKATESECHILLCCPKSGKLFEYLMILSQQRTFTLIIDEFQEFFKVSPSTYSDIQHYWDVYKEKSKINIIVCGSVYSLMHKIFENQKKPLFDRAIAKMSVKPFAVSVLKEILGDYHPKYTSEDLLALSTSTAI